jgi:hypothetical protein
MQYLHESVNKRIQGNKGEIILHGEKVRKTLRTNKKAMKNLNNM